MISIIIPTYNEEKYIATTVCNVLEKLKDRQNTEIIISDAGSADGTLNALKNLPVRAFISPIKGRAAQMNFGASKAKGNILFFLHADTIPPLHFDKLILDHFSDKNQAGCFSLKFDLDHWFLNAHSWFTKFNINSFRFGDQGLFVNKEIFLQSGRFNESQLVFEDQEIIPRLKMLTGFTVISNPVITSARKYLHYGVFKTQFVFYRVYFLYKLGWNQQKLVSLYRRLLP